MLRSSPCPPASRPCGGLDENLTAARPRPSFPFLPAASLVPEEGTGRSERFTARREVTAVKLGAATWTGRSADFSSCPAWSRLSRSADAAMTSAKPTRACRGGALASRRMAPRCPPPSILGPLGEEIQVLPEACALVAHARFTQNTQYIAIKLCKKRGGCGRPTAAVRQVSRQSLIDERSCICLQ